MASRILTIEITGDARAVKRAARHARLAALTPRFQPLDIAAERARLAAWDERQAALRSRFPSLWSKVGTWGTADVWMAPVGTPLPPHLTIR